MGFSQHTLNVDPSHSYAHAHLSIPDVNRAWSLRSIPAVLVASYCHDSGPRQCLLVIVDGLSNNDDGYCLLSIDKVGKMVFQKIRAVHMPVRIV